MVGGLVLSGQFLQSHPSTHSLGVPVAALHVVHFGHQQQGLVQVPGLEGNGGRGGDEFKEKLSLEEAAITEPKLDRP